MEYGLDITPTDVGGPGTGSITWMQNNQEMWTVRSYLSEFLSFRFTDTLSPRLAQPKSNGTQRGGPNWCQGYCRVRCRSTSCLLTDANHALDAAFPENVSAARENPAHPPQKKTDFDLLHSPLASYVRYYQLGHFGFFRNRRVA